MNPPLIKTLIALMPILVLFFGAATLYARTKTGPALAQVLGAACLIVVPLTHICEALDLFPSMGWGTEGSVGHYLDLASAILGLGLFPVGYLFHALGKRNAHAA